MRHQNKGISQERGRQGIQKAEAPIQKRDSRILQADREESQHDTCAPGVETNQSNVKQVRGSGRLPQGGEMDRKLMHLNVLRGEPHCGPRIWNLLSCKCKRTKILTLKKAISNSRANKNLHRKGKHYSIIGKLGEWGRAR